MAFVDETAGGEGAFEMEAKAMEGLGPEEEEECLVDFEGRGV